MLDSDTGLPEVPEFYYWYVGPRALNMSTVKLIRRRKYWFATEVDSRIIWTSDLNPATVRRAAEAILRSCEDQIRAKEAQAELYGQYPPNELKG